MINQVTNEIAAILPAIFITSIYTFLKEKLFKMKKTLFTLCFGLLVMLCQAQTNPANKSWLQNTTVTGSYYTVTGGSTKIANPSTTTYALGYFREDYQFVANTASDYLDIHNGRICKTPEYPNGIYCYFATVDSKWNSAYPYVVGPTFYGTVAASKVTSITETVLTYITTPTDDILSNLNINIFQIRVPI